MVALLDAGGVGEVLAEETVFPQSFWAETSQSFVQISLEAASVPQTRARSHTDGFLPVGVLQTTLSRQRAPALVRVQTPSKKWSRSSPDSPFHPQTDVRRFRFQPHQSTPLQGLPSQLPLKRVWLLNSKTKTKTKKIAERTQVLRLWRRRQNAPFLLEDVRLWDAKNSLQKRRFTGRRFRRFQSVLLPRRATTNSRKNLRRRRQQRRRPRQ